MKLQDFYTGRAFDAWTYFGSHQMKIQGVEGWIFRVYAPNALSISLYLTEVGQLYPMTQEGRSGIWEVFVEGMTEGVSYLYRIVGADGRSVDHTDPYAFSSELRPNYASITTDIDFHFDDWDWMQAREIGYNQPINVYEMHLGSWKQKKDGSFYSYTEIADDLIEYLKDLHYTHVEFMPVMEHPVDESWGYQLSGFYAATSRYGKPWELAALINRLHQEGIGVILDFVPVHFAVDTYALARFDGTALYEYPHKDTGNSEWGSFNFNYYRGEIRSFLQSSADFWISVYHCDGLRMDAISNAIYWQGNAGRGVNPGALEFIQFMNAGLSSRYPNVMKIAEDSTSYPKVTAPVRYEGLSFDYKWDMGWMNDTLQFFKSDTAFRGQEIGKLTWTMQYFYQELYMLPLSHDEVTHGKKSILNKLPGDEKDRLEQLRLLYLYMFASPGKKLNFMGYEFGQSREWNEYYEVDWEEGSTEAHRKQLEFTRALNKFYRQNPALYEQDYNSACFRYIPTNHSEVLCFERMAQDQNILAVFNFGKNSYTEKDLIIKTGDRVRLTEIFASDHGNRPYCYESVPVQAGSKTSRLEQVHMQLGPFHGILYSLEHLRSELNSSGDTRDESAGEKTGSKSEEKASQ